MAFPCQGVQPWPCLQLTFIQINDCGMNITLNNLVSTRRKRTCTCGNVTLEKSHHFRISDVSWINPKVCKSRRVPRYSSHRPWATWHKFVLVLKGPSFRVSSYRRLWYSLWDRLILKQPLPSCLVVGSGQFLLTRSGSVESPHKMSH